MGLAAQTAIAPQIPYWLALDQIPGVGPRTLLKLLTLFPDPRELWEAPPSALKPHLDPRQRDTVLAAWGETRTRINPEALAAANQAMGIDVLPLNDPAYPPLLRHIYDPPIVLYVRGNREALIGKTLAFVGTRRMSHYGRQVTETLMGELKPAHPTIVSGLALGIDGCAHQQALAEQLPTVAVFGCGIDRIFPSAHQRLAHSILEASGALVSEYPAGIPGSKSTFPQRNRIIAGLSYGVVVVEGNLRSGSLITARCAMEEGRSVFAVPGNIFSPGSEGPHALIRDGAVPVLGAESILGELQWLARPCQENPPAAQILLALDPEEQALLALVEYEPMSMDQLQARSGFSAARINQLLTLLELQGLVAQLPGAKVCRM